MAAGLAAALISRGGVTVYLYQDRDGPGPAVLDETFLASADTLRLDAPAGAEATFYYSHDEDQGWLVVSGLA